MKIYDLALQQFLSCTTTGIQIHVTNIHANIKIKYIYFYPVFKFMLYFLYSSQNGAAIEFSFLHKKRWDVVYNSHGVNIFISP